MRPHDVQGAETPVHRSHRAGLHAKGMKSDIAKSTRAKETRPLTV